MSNASRPPPFPRSSSPVVAALAAIVSLVGADDGWAGPHQPPRHVLMRPQFGRASFYGWRFAGRRTASGERLGARQMTAASRTLPLGARARVTNTANGRSVAVTVTDRGPFAKRRIIDLSRAAAERLGMTTQGVALVRIEPLQLPG